MPRPPRTLRPNGIYHIYTRGVIKTPVFLDDQDRHRFLRYLEKCVDRYGIEVRCYCLMTNHIHLLIQTPTPNLSEAMHYLFGAYASYFNGRHERSGHVFESRYFSPIVEPGWVEAELSRYIHLNPVVAGMVTHPGLYAWSSYRYFVQEGDRPGWLNPGHILGCGGGTPSSAKLYEEFVEGHANDSAEDAEKFERRVAIGTEAFRRRFEEPDLEPRSAGEQADRTWSRLGIEDDPGTVLLRISKQLGVSPDALRSRAHRDRRERVAAAHLLRILTGWPQKKIGLLLGDRSERTVARLLDEARVLLSENAEFRRWIASCLSKLSASSPNPLWGICLGQDKCQT